MIKIGSYEIVRHGWNCNLCGHVTYTDNITHKCGLAPHFQVSVVVKRIPKKKLKQVLTILEKKG